MVKIYTAGVILPTWKVEGVIFSPAIKLPKRKIDIWFFFCGNPVFSTLTSCSGEHLPWNHVWSRLEGCCEFQGFWLSEQNEGQPCRLSPHHPAGKRRMIWTWSIRCWMEFPLTIPYTCLLRTPLFTVVPLLYVLVARFVTAFPWPLSGDVPAARPIQAISTVVPSCSARERSFGPLMLKVIRVPAGLSHSLLLIMLPGMH